MKVPTVWDDRYNTRASGSILSTHKAATVMAEASSLDLVDVQSSFGLATATDLSSAHTAGYINAVITGEPRVIAESQGFTWSPEFATSVLGIWHGHQVACDLALLEKSGLVLHPVSGAHHAKADHGSGFCTLNFLAGVSFSPIPSDRALK